MFGNYGYGWQSGCGGCNCSYCRSLRESRERVAGSSKSGCGCAGDGGSTGQAGTGNCGCGDSRNFDRRTSGHEQQTASDGTCGCNAGRTEAEETCGCNTEKSKADETCGCRYDYGPEPYACEVSALARENANFRTAVWTGEYLQMTFMSICPGGEVGLEKHGSTDQMLRVEEGCCEVYMGACEDDLCFQKRLSVGDAVFVPAGTWHNIINTGRAPLKLSSVYAPPNHARCTVHATKAEADREE